MVRPSMRRRRWTRHLPRFARSTGGATAVEFGFLATPFIGLICSLMELSWVSYNAEMLQAAVTAASRAVLTGQAQTNNIADAPTFVSKLLCPTNGTRILPASFDCTKLIVDVRTATQFSTTDTSHGFYTQPLQFCLGQPSTIVVVRVAYPQPSILPLSLINQYVGLTNSFPNQTGWVHALVGTAVFQTEPYGGSAPC